MNDDDPELWVDGLWLMLERVYLDHRLGWRNDLTPYKINEIMESNPDFANWYFERNITPDVTSKE